MSEASSPAPPSTLLRVHDGGIAGGAAAVGIEHALTLRMMLTMLPHVVEHAPAIIESTVDVLARALCGEARIRDLRKVASFLARVQANPNATREESDALLCALLAVKVALVLTGDRVERTNEIREEFARALAGCGVQMVYPVEGEEVSCFGQ